ncbi:MAG TPA: glycosyltransferase [Herpetosiphonaceae bacterium]|nr:glycosyltransferase [Herpetosiphonaceae bacterium]
MTGHRNIQHVALVSPYDFAANGGVTEHVRQLAGNLRRRGIDVTIIAPASASDVDEPGLVSLGPITPVPINGSIARTTLSPVVLENVASLLTRRRFDVIHLHEPFAPMLPLSVLNASPSPNVGTFHASGKRSLPYAASRRFLRWLAQRLAMRVAVSDEAARFIRRYIGGEYTIIPNGVDTARFSPDVAPVAAWNDGRPNVLFVGRFDEPRKGLSVLIEAWPEVQQARPSARLLVVGRGEAEPFQKRASELGCRDVHFVGPVAAEDLPSYYTAATLFCAPSTGQESFGIVLVEAMSSGTPVIASDIGGYRQVLHHRREGLLVPPKQPNALAAAVVNLLSDTSLQREMSRSGRDAAAQYAWSGVSERVLQVYERAQLVHGRASAVTLSGQVVQPSLPRPSAADIAEADVVAEGPATAPKAQRPALPEGEQLMLTEPFEERVRALSQRVAGRLFGQSRISPNMVTTIGLLLTLGVTVAISTGHLIWGGVLVLLTSAFDMLDGALARATGRKSAFGAFFDSTVDRYTEALILLGILIHYDRMPGTHWEIALVYLGIVGSLMVSYTRARAEALGFDGKTGILARPERIVLLSFGLITGWLSFALAILAILTNFTTAQRVYYVWKQERSRTPRAVSPKPAPRGRWTRRNQTPS